MRRDQTGSRRAAGPRGVALWTALLLALASMHAACGRPGAPSRPDDATAGTERLTAALWSLKGGRVRDHVAALAADAMEGRETGTAGFRAAADYVADQFRAIGLVPVGSAGGYFQALELFETRLVPGTATLRLHREEDAAAMELVFAEDFVRAGGFGAAREEIEAPLAFVGHGIVAAAYGHDDYAGVDVSGKLLVVLSGAPPRFTPDERAYHSSSQVKEALAEERGAVGLLVVRTPVDEERRPWDRVLARVGSPSMRWIDAAGEPFRGHPRLAGSATLSGSGAAKLFELAGRDLEALFERHAAGATGSFEMGLSARIGRSSRQGVVTSANVLGLLPGSDPELSDEVLLYTAHLDHLGVLEGEEGDVIHNGAYDNAAGVGVILEVARAMTGLPAAPRRSVLFAALTAEEQGLQGSSYLARHFPVPIDRLVANLNVDMPYLGFPVAEVEAFGVEHSTLQDPVRRAAEAAGLLLVPDSMPEQVRFVRSDQFSFVQEGVPGLNLKPGSRSSDPSIDGAAMLADFLSGHYHRPSDDLTLPWSAEGARRFTGAALLAGLLVADADEAPRWNPGDFFAETFARR